MTTIRVTSDEVRAAQIEVGALVAAGLTPDPLILALAQATSPPEHDLPVRPAVIGRYRTYQSAVTGHFVSNHVATRGYSRISYNHRQNPDDGAADKDPLTEAELPRETHRIFVREDGLDMATDVPSRPDESTLELVEKLREELGVDILEIHGFADPLHPRASMVNPESTVASTKS